MLEVLCRSDEPLTAADVCRLAKCTTVPIQALRKQGLVHTVRKRLPVGLPGEARPAARSADRLRMDRRPSPMPIRGGCAGARSRS